jgi:hypothetical protein
MQESQLLNKKFKFKMPVLTKSAGFKTDERDEFGAVNILSLVEYNSQRSSRRYDD